MRKQNTEVVFPNITGQETQLELHFRDQPFEFNTLPNTLQAGPSLEYIKWLSRLTSNDPKLRERASRILLDKETDKLIYPPNPNIGNSNQATPFKADKSRRFISICRTHSHVNEACFSSQDWKLLCIESAISSRSAELLGAQENNFLLLKCADSNLLPANKGSKMMDDFKEKEAIQLTDKYTDYINMRLMEYLSNENLKYSEAQLTEPAYRSKIVRYAILSTTLYLNAYFADQLKFGLYGNTDGNTFYRITLWNVLPVINQIIEGSLPELKKRIFS